MPRIRNWKDLVFFRVRPSQKLKHLDALFSDTVDWKLIQTLLPDMWRVVLSIKAGKINASTILRKLGTNSRKNKLFKAFQALGSAVRTGFLMEYIHDAKLRSTINALAPIRVSRSMPSLWQFRNVNNQQSRRAAQADQIQSARCQLLNPAQCLGNESDLE